MIYRPFVFLSMFCLLATFGCGSGDDVRALRSQIRAAAADGTIDAAECATLRAAAADYESTMALTDAEWEAFLTQAKPRDVESLAINCASATSTAPASAPEGAGNCPPDKDVVNVYVENSGSMYGYFDKQGALFGTLTDFVGQFDKREQQFAYYLINNETFAVDELPGPNQGKPGNFSRQRHLESWLAPAKMGTKGDRSSSKLMEVINNVSLQTIDDCQPRMIFSDFVYSLTANRDMEKEMNRVKSGMSVIFNAVAKAGLATLMVKFDGAFDGYYYPRNSPNKGYKYKGKRPFYAWVIASPDYLKTFPAEYTIDRLPGYIAHAIIAPTIEGVPEYTILPYSAEPRGRFQASPRGKGVPVRALQDAEPSDRGGSAALRFAVGADLSALAAPASYVNNPDNYRVDGGDEDNWRVVEVLSPENIDAQDRGRAQNPLTHLLVLEADDLSQRSQDLEIKLLDQQPNWLRESHTDSDLQPEIDAIAGKTFGYRYLIDGVWDSYHPRRDELLFFTLPVTISR